MRTMILLNPHVVRPRIRLKSPMDLPTMVHNTKALTALWPCSTSMSGTTHHLIKHRSSSSNIREILLRILTSRQ
ncbi:hypothetical protein HanPSC8_Chr04g0136441 [Helianthus annuus]|nr:hypothetical protein HanPSC8_Chr04g0136441 [Helianthus annuus]